MHHMHLHIPNCFKSIVLYINLFDHAVTRVTSASHNKGQGTSLKRQQLSYLSTHSAKVVSAMKIVLKFLNTTKTQYELSLKETLHIKWLITI